MPARNNTSKIKSVRIGFYLSEDVADTLQQYCYDRYKGLKARSLVVQSALLQLFDKEKYPVVVIRPIAVSKTNKKGNNK
jgi:hypothetical protein